MQFFKDKMNDNIFLEKADDLYDLAEINLSKKSVEECVIELINQKVDVVRMILQSQSLLDLYELAIYLDQQIKKAKERNKISRKKDNELKQKKTLYKLVKKAFAHHLTSSMLYVKIKEDAKAYVKAHQKPLLKRLTQFIKNLMGQNGPRDRKLQIFNYHLRYQQEINYMNMAKEGNTYLDMIGKEKLAILLKVSRVEIASCKIEYKGGNEFEIEMTRMTSRISGLGTEKYTIKASLLQTFLEEQRITNQLDSCSLELPKNISPHR